MRLIVVQVQRIVQVYWRVLAGLSLFLAACGGVSQPDVQATVTAGDSLLATDAAVINATAVIERTQIAGTVAANEREIASIRQVNQVLGGTVEAGSTPTPGLEVIVMPPPPDGDMAIGGRDSIAPAVPGGTGAESMDPIQAEPVENTTDISNSNLTATGITDAVDAGGCPLNSRSTFSDVSQLYFTFRANGLPQGTTLRIVWEYAGNPVVQDSWTTPEAFDDACLWLIITQSNVQFTAGDWAAMLYIGEQQVTERVTFTVQ